MEKFNTGNVVKLASGSLVIITGYRNITRTNLSYKVCDYVFVNFSNMSGCSRIDTITSKESCSCSMVNGTPIDDCEDCDGKGKFIETREGMDKAKLVASTVKDWIVDTLTSKFNF